MRTDLVSDDVVEENPCSASSRLELKRIHQWLTEEESGSELFSNKRQVVEIDSGFLTPLMSAWDDSLLPPRQFTNPQHTSDLLGRYISPIDQEVLHGGVSRSFETGPSYEDSSLSSLGQTFSNIDKSFIFPRPFASKPPDGNFIPNLSYDKGDENVFSTFHPFEKGVENFALMGHSLQKADDFLPCHKESESLFMIESSYHKENANVVFSGGQSHPYMEGNEMAFNMVPSQEKADKNSDQTSHVDRSTISPVPAKDHLHMEAEDNISFQSRYPPYASSRVVDPLLVPKSKDSKTAKKGSSTNTFPSNVKSLLSTGMFDGVTVKYYSWSREKNLKGVIKGTGYLCGCDDCNLNKVLNAYEFEQHANCKTKHPNNHIYFENGKTVYGVVQELKNTPQEKLFEAIQNVTGSDINYKNFNTWKASYQVASLELQRIYGKDAVTLAS
ncbi:hypothetical protein N665_0006s0113 [Sinapis alba]|nr:hypothetical protein N665_0006s0113 [Sinapis alba]